MRTRSLLLTLIPAAVAACAETPDTFTYNREVTVVPAGATCADLGLGANEFRIESPTDGVYSIDAQNQLTFRYYDDTNTIFYYTNASIRMDGVLVHGGGSTAVWELPSANGWPSLHGAIDPATGEPYVPEAVSFCFTYSMFLNPNGYAHTGRQHHWSIDKTGFAGSLLLAEGQSYLAQYAVTVTPTGSTETGPFVAGPVFVNNPTPYTPRLDGVSVMVGEIAATVTCPVTFPYVLPAFTTLTCDFRADVPDTADRPIVVDVASDGQLPITRSLETASFADPTTSVDEVDECVKVLDDRVPYTGGFLGTVCVGEGAKTFTYSVEVGPYDVCGPFEVVNTATFVGLDTGATGSDSWTVGGNVPCEDGCTLTPGYWKTHSEYGPARYDETWALVGGADAAFFGSGQTWYQVLWTAPKGNAYYILAHAYIAAALNQLNDASFTAAADAFAQATALFQQYSPSDATRRSLKPLFIDLATTLDDYNNGRIGPGHCTE